MRSVYSSKLFQYLTKSYKTYILSSVGRKLAKNFGLKIEKIKRKRCFCLQNNESKKKKRRLPPNEELIQKALYTKIESLSGNQREVVCIELSWVVYNESEFERAKKDRRYLINAIKDSIEKLGWLVNEPIVNLKEGNLFLVSGICRFIALKELAEERKRPAAIFVRVYNNLRKKDVAAIKEADNL